MNVILAIAMAWLFLLVLALSLFRSAARADREADTRHRAGRAALLAAALPLAGAAAGVSAPDVNAKGCANAHGASAEVTLCLINGERRSRGLAPLGADALLARAARRHAADMVARGFFSHDAPGGVSFVDRLRRVGYPRCAWRSGETLGWGAGTRVTPASRVAAWMQSPPHRHILLSPGFRDAGIGIAAGVPDGSARGFTYVAEFGRRRC